MGKGYLMDETEMQHVIDWVALTIPITYVRLIGGEPLTHPLVNQFINSIHLAGLEVELATNGILLDRLDYHALLRLYSIKITDYGDRNRKAVDAYRSWPNVTIINSMDRWRDPEEDRKVSLSEVDGKIAYNRCPMGTIKVCDGKIWDCCAAESLEREYQLTPTHVPLTRDWKKALDLASHATTCQHCYFGRDTITNLKEIGEYNMERDKI